MCMFEQIKEVGPNGEFVVRLWISKYLFRIFYEENIVSKIFIFLKIFFEDLILHFSWDWPNLGFLYIYLRIGVLVGMQ